MEELNDGRLLRNAGYIARVLVGLYGLIFSVWAFAIDTSQCGYLQCEQAIATNSYSCQDFIAIGGSCECQPHGAPGHLAIYQVARGIPGWYGDFAPCNCAAQPPIPAGQPFGGGVSGRCVAGCQYSPGPPPGGGAGFAVCVEAPRTLTGGGGSRTCDGEQHANGANCDPLADNPPADPPAPDPTCDAGGDACLHPDAESSPPKVCGTFNGQTVCVPADGSGPCEGGRTTGYLCAGPTDPGPPMPPPPPDTPPSNPPTSPPTPGPPTWQASGDNCTGSGCVPITINHYGPCPPEGCTQPNSCPPGTHIGSGGQCIADPPQTCPDGSQPHDGLCVAPEVCPDGTQPVNHQCIAPWNSCPDGTPPVSGACAPHNGLCPNGSAPVPPSTTCPVGLQNCPNGNPPDLNGMCPAGAGTCPNGSQPVNGQCPAGAPCNPDTDPNHCQNPQGNAGGGQTCGAAPYCTGDPVNCQVLQQEWNTRCAVENLAKKFAVTGTPPDGHEGERESDTNIVSDNSMDMLGQIKSDGFLGGGGSCPRPPTFTVWGHSFDFTNIDWWCSALAALAAVIYFVGAFIALRILMGD